jgi:hypothetical protein
VAGPRRFELEDLLIRPGTYFNPQTEIMVVVDDTPEVDREIFDSEDVEGAEWVLISDEAPLDEALRDEAIERFQATYQSGDAHASDEDHEDDEDEERLEPDEEDEEDEDDLD